MLGHDLWTLGLGFGAIWLTDYHSGSVARISVEDAAGKVGAEDAAEGQAQGGEA